MNTDAMTSPYRGLTPYTEADAAYFFGRTAESATVAANLEVSRLTIFYGPSGVGKSSVLRAGVIHQLRQRARQNVLTGGAAEIIPIYFNRWQSDPMAGLVQAVEAGIEGTGDQRPETGDRETLDSRSPISNLRSPLTCATKANAPPAISSSCWISSRSISSTTRTSRGALRMSWWPF